MSACKPKPKPLHKAMLRPTVCFKLLDPANVQSEGGAPGPGQLDPDLQVHLHHKHVVAWMAAHSQLLDLVEEPDSSTMLATVSNCYW